jgi:hypothetical protein
MTSKIKVDNIENQCGGAVVTKCGGTTTITGSVVKSNALQASDAGNIISQSGTTITLGASGDTINLASGASQSGFGRTGTVDWDTTPKTATFTAVNGTGYFVNTTAGVITVNLPAGSAGNIVSLADYAATWQTSNVTVTPNGTDKIGSQNENAVLSTQGQSVTFVYVDSTQGWINTMDSTSNVRGNPPFMAATGGTITECGNCKVHTFTGPGTFEVTRIATCCAVVNNLVSYVVVAGGGGGSAGNTPAHGAGGGGAGGYREVVSPSSPYTGSPLNGYPSAPNRITVTATSYPIAVGGGGPSGPGCATVAGCQGNPSTFSSITSTGGGGGGGGATGATSGTTGGSGGGGSSEGPTGGANPSPTSGGAGGAGNTPPVSPSQGNQGGYGNNGPGPSLTTGAGGGATAVGQNGSPGLFNGGGGAGATTSINGSSTTFSGGGGGGGTVGITTGGTGGSGGGATGVSPNSSGSAATVNTGGGGGGGGGGPPVGSVGTNGGSGIVIIRYKFQ